jgi:exonuclease III
MDAVADVIVQMNPDILNLVEVQDCSVLKALNTKLNEKAGRDLKYIPYLIQGTDTSTGQNVGLLTRIDPSVSLARSDARESYPIAGNRCGHTATGMTGVSKHYYTTFNIPGLSKPLTMIGAHFLAFPTNPDRCTRREAQAKVLQAVTADAINKDQHVITLGDLNDYDGESKNIDRANNVPNSRVLNFLKDVNATAGLELQNVASHVQQLQRYSSFWDQNSNCKADPGDLTLIDHVLVSNSLLTYIESVEYFHPYEGTCGFYPDHWPIVIKFRF